MPSPFIQGPRALARVIPPAPRLTVVDGQVVAEARAPLAPRLSVDDAAVTAEASN